MPMIHLADYLREDLVFWDLPVLDKPAFLRALTAQLAQRLPELNPQELAEFLLAREAKQSSGIGHGLAVPHAVVPGLPQTLLAVVRAQPGLDFEALDSRPVDLLFLLLSPPETGPLHLRVLARLARIVDSAEVLATLRGAKAPAELYQMLLAEDAQHG
jgi:PTS system nitrogen regulatory IIA component